MSNPRGSPLIFRRVPAGVRRAALDGFACLLRDQVARGCEFECLITNDRELQRLNREFRGKDYATDVLSFPAEEIASEPFLGSLAISAQRASAQAKEYGHSREQEIEILMLHGLLHLAGMDHAIDTGQMARAEARWRKRLQLPPGLVERVGG
jgi:probable rRNA maturation factor